MRTTKVTIKASSLPMGSPLGIIILFGLLLDRLAAPGWVWGVVGTLALALVIEFIRQRTVGQEHDVPGFGELS
ncbi:hypothetical protein [Massilia sp. TSP1-1-2]|uniref:hypothetical protein n=1 Tax=Massilia sp. TSP1-1-2 TaxID=2804649 RepID=UPI003CEBBD7E